MNKLINKHHHTGNWNLSVGSTPEDIVKNILSQGFPRAEAKLLNVQTNGNFVEFKAELRYLPLPHNLVGAPIKSFNKPCRVTIEGVGKINTYFISSMSYTPTSSLRVEMEVTWRQVSTR